MCVCRRAGGTSRRRPHASASLPDVEVCTKKITWHRTYGQGALRPTDLWAARCQASCVGVRTGMLLTWEAPVGNTAAHPEDARQPPFPGLSPATSRGPGCGATHLRPLPPRLSRPPSPRADDPLTSPPSPNSHLSRRRGEWRGRSKGVTES